MNRIEPILRLLLSLGVSLFILALILSLFLTEEENVSRVRLMSALKNISFAALLPYVVCQIGQTYFRAMRYRVLLLGGKGNVVPDMGRMFLVSATRNMFVDMLPARLGELTYLAMLNRGYNVPANLCLSSLTVSVLFDFMALFIFVGTIILYSLTISHVEGWMLTSLLVLTLLIGIGAGILFFGIHLAVKMKKYLTHSFQEIRLVRLAFNLAQSFAEAMDQTRRACIFWKVFALSILIRGLKYTGLFFTFLAVVTSNFPEFASLSFPEVFAALFGSEAGASMPIPTFMSFGSYEAGGTLALTLLGFSAEASILGLLTMHICSQFVDYTLGAAAILVFIMTVRKDKNPTPTSAPIAWKRYAAIACIIFLFGGGISALNLRKLKKSGVLEAQPEAGHEERVGDSDLRAARQLLGNREGMLVWSSNRYGNHDILLMTLSDMRIHQLTSHPHTEYFPRISSDGKKIVFARSKIPWVSQRDILSWEIWMLDLETRKEIRIAESGNVPTWSLDGQKIYFQRNGKQFVQHDLKTGSEEILFESGKNGIQDGLDIQTPDYDETRGLLAVTFRGIKQVTMLCSKHEDPIQIGGGCQLSWSPDHSWLYYVDKPGDIKNAFYRMNFETRKKELLLDMPMPYSHEYFPRISNDDQFLICGASTGGHEHDQADYEIFLWKMGEPRESVVQLTFHTGNDCWPDLFLKN